MAVSHLGGRHRSSPQKETQATMGGDGRNQTSTESPKTQAAMGGDGRNQTSIESPKTQAAMGGNQGKEGQGGGQPKPTMTMTIPVGFRFDPTDEQLVSCYLKEKLRGGSASPSPSPWMEGLVVDFDIYRCDPWDLPRHRFNYPGFDQRGGIMYFFTPTHAPAANTTGQGQRVGRTAGCGVWHGNGKDVLIRGLDSSTGRPAVVGHTTSFKFVKLNKGGDGARRINTDWLMHEYRLHRPTVGAGRDPDNRRGSVLSKIYYKGGGSRKMPGDYDGVVDWAQPQQYQPPPKRKRAVDEPPEQANPFSPDTPLMLCWEGHPQESESESESDQMPAVKRRRVAPPPPEAEDVLPDPLDAAFALDLEVMLDTTDALPVPPPPPSPSAPGAQLMTGSADPSASADDQSGCPPSMPSSSDDPFAMLSADALPCLPPLPSSPPSMTGVDWGDFADPWSFAPGEGTPLGSFPLLDDTLQYWADLPSPPPAPVADPWSFGPEGTPLLDDTSFVSPSFHGYNSSFWQDPSFF